MWQASPSMYSKTTFKVNVKTGDNDTQDNLFSHKSVHKNDSYKSETLGLCNYRFIKGQSGT